jgi:NADPH-dependent curcumin reductase CurA
MSVSTREVHLVARPRGEPAPADFAVREVALAGPAPGQVLVRTLAMSVDPYMRGRMSARRSYAPSWELDRPMQGGAVGQVVASRAPAVAEGALVLHGDGWREHAVLPAERVRVLRPQPDLPLSYHLGVLGMPGLTAYAGLFRLGEFKAGDAVFVSGAAGAVGSLVGQFARLRGASRVVGSAGSAAKVRWLTEDLGFDAAFDYHDASVVDQLRAAAPDGIDVYFDNVGGEHLQAAIDAMNRGGRLALCGAISSYNATSRPVGPNNLFLAIGQRLTLRGFIIHDHADLEPEFAAVVGGWLRAGELIVRETVVDGLEAAVPAFLDLLRGGNTGKMIVRLAPDPD